MNLRLPEQEPPINRRRASALEAFPETLSDRRYQSLLAQSAVNH